MIGRAGVATCWVPAVPAAVGGGPVPRSLTHVSNVNWQIVEHDPCTILFFGMGVKLSAKLAGIDAKRIIAATLNFISPPQKLEP